MASNPPKAEYKQLARVDFESPYPSLVPWLRGFALGTLGDGEDDALPLLKAAYDRGMNTWDTAKVYPNAVSEKITGIAIEQYRMPRHKLVICFKCCGTVGERNSPEVVAPKDIEDTVNYVNQRGLSRYIRFDKTVPVEETMKALHIVWVLTSASVPT